MKVLDSRLMIECRDPQIKWNIFVRNQHFDNSVPHIDQSPVLLHLKLMDW